MQPIDLTELASRPGLVGALASLLRCSELNLDEMEDHTREQIDRAWRELEKACRND